MMNAKEMMKLCNDNCIKNYKAKAVVKNVQDLMSKVDINKEDFYLAVVCNTKYPTMMVLTKNELLNMSFSEMIEWDKKYANPKYEAVLMVKTKPKYLDKVEENYLRNIIAPLARSGCCDFKVEKVSLNEMSYIDILMYNANSGMSTCISLPAFKKSSNMYKDLQNHKSYSIDYLVK